MTNINHSKIQQDLSQWKEVVDNIPWFVDKHKDIVGMLSDTGFLITATPDAKRNLLIALWQAAESFIESTPSKAYKLIEEYYGNKVAERSGVPLMNHINEGITILNSINADQITIDAYCLHPILQSDESFNNNYQNVDFTGISSASIILAVEYRRVANSYLSRATIDQCVGFTNNKMKQMLYADKVQNEKDFRLYHEGKHERSKELREYFDNWLNKLLI